MINLTTIRECDFVMEENIFGARLKKVRQDRNLSRQNLADKTGISMNVIYYYESGRRSPSAEYVKKLAETLNVSIDYLLGRTDYEKILNDNHVSPLTLPVYDLNKVEKGDLSTGKVDEKIVSLSLFNDCAYWILITDDELSPLISKGSYILMSEKGNFQNNTMVLVNVDNIFQIKLLKRYEKNNSILSDFSGMKLLFEKDHEKFELLSTVVLFSKK